jgi:hypothetical protein
MRAATDSRTVGGSSTDERGLADPSLPGDDDHSAPSRGSLRERRRQRVELRLALEQLRVRCHTRGQRKIGMAYAVLVLEDVH